MSPATNQNLLLLWFQSGCFGPNHSSANTTYQALLEDAIRLNCGIVGSSKSDYGLKVRMSWL